MEWERPVVRSPNTTARAEKPTPRRSRLRGIRLSGMDVFAYIVITVFAVATIYPFLNVAAVSLTSHAAYIRHPWTIVPREIETRGYKLVLTHPLVRTSYRNTVIITVAGSVLSMALTILTAYPLSRPSFKAKPFFVYMIIVTMLFSGGLIPNFYLVRSLGMYNTLWALIIPGSLSAFNIILLVNFFKSIPAELIDSARIDGASELIILTRLVLPLSLAILATLLIFYAVGRWNSFFSAVIYIRERNKWTMQLLLREVVMEATNALQSSANPAEIEYISPQNVRYAAIMITVLPIILVYPFLQRYYIKGVMVGAIKG